MSFDRRINGKMVGGVAPGVGDRYHASEMLRDIEYNLEQSGLAHGDIVTNGGQRKIKLAGGIVSKGVGDTISITPGAARVPFQVEMVNSFASIPYPTTVVDQEFLRFNWPQITDQAIPSATLDGVATNYVKMRPVYNDGNTRAKSDAAGSYAADVVIGYVLKVDTVAPTDYEIAIATFIGSAGGDFWITDYTPSQSIAANGIEKLFMASHQPGYCKDPFFNYGFWRGGSKSIVDDTANGGSLTTLRLAANSISAPTAIYDPMGNGGYIPIPADTTSGEYGERFNFLVVVRRDGAMLAGQLRMQAEFFDANFVLIQQRNYDIPYTRLQTTYRARSGAVFSTANARYVRFIMRGQSMTAGSNLFVRLCKITEDVQWPEKYKYDIFDHITTSQNRETKKAIYGGFANIALINGGVQEVDIPKSDLVPFQVSKIALFFQTTGAATGQFVIWTEGLNWQKYIKTMTDNGLQFVEDIPVSGYRANGTAYLRYTADGNWSTNTILRGLIGE